MCSRTGIYERVIKEDVLGYRQCVDDIDSNGEFLFRHRSFLDRYASEAISRFGPGQGCKADAEGATLPYWSLEEGGDSYLQESAEAIQRTAGDVRRLDGQ